MSLSHRSGKTKKIFPSIKTAHLKGITRSYPIIFVGGLSHGFETPPKRGDILMEPATPPQVISKIAGSGSGANGHSPKTGG
jgi:hypothetical protein